MSVESKPNRLTKGLVLDTFHTDVDNTVATYALNSQLEDQEGNHFHYGSEVGTNHIKDIPDNHVVIGHINMERNETVLFTTDGTNSTIGILSRNDDMSYNYEIKVDDTDQKKKLNFKKNGYVRGVYRLLNGCDKVIYFVDGVNKDRRVNFNKLDSYKDPASTASGIIFDDSLKATIYALSSATGNIQLIRLMSASPEATANVLATLTSGAELTKLLTASANGIGTALANLIRTANIVSSIEATGTSTVNVDIVRLLQSNVSAIGSVNAILESLQQGIVEIDVTLTGVASSTAILLRAALLEVNLTTEATTLANAILTRIINAQIQALANTESSAQISIPINAAVDAIATTAADAILSYAINATVDAMAQTSATAQLSKVITASVDALADSSSELLIGLVLVSTNIAGSSTSTANLFINRLLTSSVTAQGTTTAEAVIAKLLSSSLTSTSTTTADSLISKLLASTVDATGTVTADLQLADLLSTTVNGTASISAVLEAISSLFTISRSLRFNSADSTHLTRTFSVAGTRTTWTWSGWVKLSNFSSSGFIFGASSGLNIDGGITINIPSNYIGISLNGNVYNKNVTVTLRDTSAWYHIVGVFNTTLSTPADRIKIYVNGIEFISYTTVNSGLPPQNFIPNYLNNANLHTIGKLSGYDQDYLNCYMTEVNFIDGLALTPDSFGERDINTGVWRPKDYTGVYGTNGFHLNFSDNTNTTATTLGKDYSGNNNNWTPSGFSITSGTGNDSLTDVPTPYGTDTGVGGEVRGNYAVLNPLETTTLTKPTNGNLDYSPSNIAPQVAISTIAIPSTGKWYAEVTKGSSSSSFSIGVIGTLRTAQYAGHTDSIGYFDNGQIYKDNSLIQSSLAAYAFGDTIGIAVDAVAQTVQFYKNGLTVGTAISYTYSQISFACGNYLSGQIYNVNFGQRPFAYQAPTGFKALNTANLPTPAIGGGGESNLANKYMDITTYTGTGAAQSIFNSGFKPDFVWIKSRSNQTSHMLYDISRGVTKHVSCNSESLEVTNANGLTSFNNTGFSIGTLTDINASGATYVAWQWRAGGTPVTNNSGTITSQVSVSPISGFSIVRYTVGASGGGTVGHGLGVAPKFIINKVYSRNESFRCYFESLGPTRAMYLQITNVSTVDPVWGNTAPTSSLFTIGNAYLSNGDNVVAYCFAEIQGYSKFSSYLGNNSTDGTFVYTGFKPKYILIKCSTAAGNWVLYNSIVNTGNPVINELFANTTAAENSVPNDDIDFLSNGFKLRSTNAAINAAQTYVYAAFAETPFKYATAALSPEVKNTVTVDYLVVGGGGGGGYGGGGGGAGQLLTGTSKILPASFTITVGTGGDPGNSTQATSQGINGVDSILHDLTAIGGGGGGGYFSFANGKNGASGGGSGHATSGTPTAGTGTAGNNGGGSKVTSPYATGGGGGASSVGGTGNATNSGNGGNGTSSSITGSAVIYAAGGGGGGYSLVPNGIGGSSSVGGNGGRDTPFTDATQGTDFTGSGGGGSDFGTGSTSPKRGGHGVVIITYSDSLADLTTIPGTLTYTKSVVAGLKIYRFTSGTGTITR